MSDDHIESIDPYAPGAEPVVFDPVLDAALGGLSDHRWEVALAEFIQKYDLPADSTLHDVGNWLMDHGHENDAEHQKWLDALANYNQALPGLLDAQRLARTQAKEKGNS